MAATFRMALSPRLRNPARAMDRAKSYDDWKVAAIAHDQASGAAGWKAEDRSRIYDYVEIRKRLDVLRDCRARGDDLGLLYALNEGVHGNMGGMGKAELYARARFGTKQLIMDYVAELCGAMEHLASANVRGIGRDERLEFFRRASLCFGRSALLLSGGGIYGHFHVGVIQALLDQDLLPRVISGSSAGALIASIVGTHDRATLADVLAPDNLLVRRAVASTAGTPGTLGRLLPRMSQDELQHHFARIVPDLTFAEAYERTGIALNISVSPAEVHQTSRLMNAVTSPNVLVRSALAASCAVPGIYPPVQLMARDRGGVAQPYVHGQRWVDGSVSNDLPARRISRLYGVNHYIVSQVNPFALVHRPVQHSQSVGQDLKSFAHHSSKNVARLVQEVAGKYARRWPDVLMNLNNLTSVWMQEYGGDINILPPPGLVRPWHALRHPTVEMLAGIIEAGERATWPHVEMIRNHTALGRTLIRILRRLENRNTPSTRDVAAIHWPEATR